MKRMNAIAAAGLAAALVAACAGASAQDGPAPDGRGFRRAARMDAPREADPEVDAWAEALAARVGDGNPMIRRSAHAGLAALGPAALPVLGRLAGAEDRAVAAAAIDQVFL